jgi:hypothetical protein
MRNVPTDVASVLSSGEQIEPVTIVSVDLSRNAAGGGGSAGGTASFADRNVYDVDDPTRLVTPGRILEVAGLEEAQRSDSTGMAGSVTITLDDSDGAMKALFDGLDMHLRKVSIAVAFARAGGGATSSVPLFRGVVGTPIVWDEGKRTLTFDVVSRLADSEMGWSPEMGTYTLLPQELVGQAWPMVFGTVQHSPCIKLDTIPTAFTTEPFGIPDRTVKSEIARLNDLLALAVSATEYYSLLAADRNPSDPLDFEGRVQKDPTVKQYVQMQVDIHDRITELEQVQSFQAQWQRGSVGLIPTVYVTRPYEGLFRVGDGLFNGVLTKDGGSLNCTPQLLPGSPAAAQQREGFQWYNAGEQAVIAGSYPLRYVAAITPGTVLKVWAMRSFNGLRQMAEVPPSYYTIQTQAIGRGMTATYVVLKRPLSTTAMLDNLYTDNWENTFGKALPPHIVNQVDWEDDLYVTFESEVGPNPADIMTWAIANFSQIGYDSDSFQALRTKTDGLPMNFTLADNPSVMSFLSDLAYQCKSLVYVKDDTFFSLYLPAVPDPVDSISEDDVMVDGLQVTCTSTEDLVTRYTATYRPDYSPFFEEPVKMVVRYNLPKYGLHSEDHDFYAYNNWAPVQSALTFWLIRRSQTYKILKARLLLSKINVEVFDYITLDFDRPYVASSAVTGLVTRCVVDTANKWVDVEVWCPVLLGEMAQHPYVWPSGAGEQVYWPQYHNMAGGGGGGDLSTPDAGGANPRTEQVGQTDVRDTLGIWGRDGASGPILQPIDQGASQPEEPPSVPEPHPWSKRFPRTPTPVPAPKKDYAYDDPDTPDLPNGAYPGKVKKKAGGGEAGEGSGEGGGSGRVDYEVDVYLDGLAKDPQSMTVTQLQIDPDDTIPEDTWVLVSVVNTKDDQGKPVASFSMQVPVWLQ